MTARVLSFGDYCRLQILKPAVIPLDKLNTKLALILEEKYGHGFTSVWKAVCGHSVCTFFRVSSCSVTVDRHLIMSSGGGGDGMYLNYNVLVYVAWDEQNGKNLHHTLSFLDIGLSNVLLYGYCHNESHCKSVCFCFQLSAWCEDALPITWPLSDVIVAIVLPLLVMITKTFMVISIESLLCTALALATYLVQWTITITMFLYINLAGCVSSVFWLCFGVWWTVTCTCVFLTVIYASLSPSFKRKLDSVWGK